MDLARAQRAVVDPDLVDQAREPLRPDRVAAYPERAGRGCDQAGREEASDLASVDVETEGDGVVGRGQVRPRVEWEAGRAVYLARAAGNEDLAVRSRLGLVVCIEPVDEIRGLLLEDDSPPESAERTWLDPALERHPERQVERARIRDADPVADAVH